MAIINFSYGFTFVHVPKVAGTSLTNFLSQFNHYCDLEVGATKFGESIQNAYKERFGIAKHSTALQLRNIIGHVEWSKTFSFAFVRNPYERAISTFNFLRQWDAAPPKIRADLLGFRSFEEFVLSGYWDERNGPDNIFMPQLFWLCDTLKSKNILVDYVGRMENLNDELSVIVSRIAPNAPTSSLNLPRLNKSTNPAGYEIKDKSVIKALNRKYEADFQVFEYELM